MVVPSVLTVQARSRLAGNFSLADLGPGRGCQELVLVSCCVQGREAHPNHHQQLSVARWVSGHKHTRNPLPDDFSDSVHVTSRTLPAGHGAAMPGAGKQRPFVPTTPVAQLQADAGPRLGCVTPLPPPLAQGLCNHLASRTWWRTGKW